jgi:hypothetical protein
VAYEYREFPEFSWSPSRQRQLDDCPRAYYYRYYLSWNGWLAEAAPDRRETYRLGKLTGFDALFGREIDRRAREIERAARRGSTPPSVDEMERRTRAALNDAWRSSKRERQRFEASPKQVTMLRAVYLGEDGRDEIDRVEQRLRTSLECLAAREHWRRIGACGREGRIEIPDFDSFTVDDVKVFALPDLAYVHRGTLHVVDWKSGRRGDGYRTQVLLSSFWALSTEAGREAGRAEGHLEYLSLGEEEHVEIPEDHEGRVTAVVQAGVEKMRALLRDPKLNAPLEMTAFERRESGLCRSCNFGPLCTRHRAEGR